METARARVCVVDDHEVVRRGVAAIVERAPDLEMAGAYDSAEAALVAIPGAPPDVVLLDQCLPGISGTTACREIVRRWPAANVVIFTAICREEVLHAALAAGARGFLLKVASSEELTEAVRTAARGEVVLCAEALGQLVQWVRTSGSMMDQATLSPHEVDTLSLISQGWTNREVARSLGVTEGAMKVYLRSLKRKLDADDRSEAVAAGIRRGVI